MTHPHRSPARWLAPVALLACALAVFLVVAPSLSHDDTGTTNTIEKTRDASSSSSAKKGSGKKKRKNRVYRVKPGDTMSAIAEKTGVPLSELQELNPDLDAQALQTGQKVKLGP